jgi:hypothetical protein
LCGDLLLRFFFVAWAGLCVFIGFDLLFELFYPLPHLFVLLVLLVSLLLVLVDDAQEVFDLVLGLLDVDILLTGHILHF